MEIPKLNKTYNYFDDESLLYLDMTVNEIVIESIIKIIINQIF